MKTSTRVFYKDTDKMGVVYYANYLYWFEIGRAEYMRSIGCSYKELEEKNYLMPVIEALCKYHHPATYDETIEIDTSIGSISKLKLRFDYKIFRKDDMKLLAEGYTIHAYVDRNGKIQRLPQHLIDLLNSPEDNNSKSFLNN
ncbi:MAG: hypothetical protein A2Y62_09685 [Candidatus Fischerbacteria bacterium RBG_13_37_8]|uniref:Uncharacterized protein n=1 Tax=Candidatus Fischerbacteria bacterium RBG_13_37_8 TaxID=1817863 RepID=A0A1F5V5R3_9BACT|nr:MAG: hypothetical protein A2Y62_09685 [Candidatus Fischerbacteria bacterium RBG_13_37_8]